MLLITAGERPASIYFRGGTVYILPHDEWYIKQCTAMMIVAIKTHKDKRVSSRGFVLTGETCRLALHALREFQKREEKFWYGPLGLKPPRFHFNRDIAATISISSFRKIYRSSHTVARQINAWVSEIEKGIEG